MGVRVKERTNSIWLCEGLWVSKSMTKLSVDCCLSNRRCQSEGKNQ